MNNRRYIVTESFFHVSYLMDKLQSKSLIPIVRDKLNLDVNALNKAHHDLAGKKILSKIEMATLELAYQHDLSKPELALINMYGVPEQHPLSLPNTQRYTNLNSVEVLNSLALSSYKSSLCAAIFLDCVLKPRWLEIFGNRIVNAHSAILPRARGMYAIEQVAALGDAKRFERCAGASIHYIDEKVDMGSLIKAEFLSDLWSFESLWEVKAASYMKAFNLLSDYIDQPFAFSYKDASSYQEAPGPEFKSKEFNREIEMLAVNNFKKMRYEYSNGAPVAEIISCSNVARLT